MQQLDHQDHPCLQLWLASLLLDLSGPLPTASAAAVCPAADVLTLHASAAADQDSGCAGNLQWVSLLEQVAPANRVPLLAPEAPAIQTHMELLDL